MNLEGNVKKGWTLRSLLLGMSCGLYSMMSVTQGISQSVRCLRIVQSRAIKFEMNV